MLLLRAKQQSEKQSELSPLPKDHEYGSRATGEILGYQYIRRGAHGFEVQR